MFMCPCFFIVYEILTAVLLHLNASVCSYWIVLIIFGSIVVRGFTLLIMQKWSDSNLTTAYQFSFRYWLTISGARCQTWPELKIEQQISALFRDARQSDCSLLCTVLVKLRHALSEHSSRLYSKWKSVNYLFGSHQIELTIFQTLDAVQIYVIVRDRLQPQCFSIEYVRGQIKTYFSTDR